MARTIIDHGPKALFVARDLAKEANGGSGTYRLDFLRYLKSMGFEIEYLCFNHATCGKEAWGVIPAFWDDLAHVVVMPAANRSQVVAWTAFPTEVEVALFKARVSGFQPDVIITDRVWLAGLFDHVPAQMRHVTRAILAHEVCYQRVRAFAEAGIAPWKRSEGLEAPLWEYDLEAVHLQKAQMVLAIQEEDCASFQRMAPGVEVIHVPMAATAHPYLADKQIPGRSLFVGGNGTLSNAHGLKWFLRDVWPLVLQMHPEATLHVCGNICKEVPTFGMPSPLRHASLLGNVSEEVLDTQYAQAQVCLTPIKVGSGLKLKLVAAIAHGRAGVSTSVGLQGIQQAMQCGAVALADEPEAFAKAVVRFHVDCGARRKAELMARRFAMLLSPDVVYSGFVEAVYRRLYQLSPAPVAP